MTCENVNFQSGRFENCTIEGPLDQKHIDVVAINQTNHLAASGVGFRSNFTINNQR